MTTYKYDCIDLHSDLYDAYEMFCFVFLQVCKQFTEAGFMADADLDSGCLLNKKIRNAQLAQYNFILGEKMLLLCTSEVLPDH